MLMLMCVSFYPSVDIIFVSVSCLPDYFCPFLSLCFFVSFFFTHVPLYVYLCTPCISILYIYLFYNYLLLVVSLFLSISLFICFSSSICHSFYLLHEDISNTDKNEWKRLCIWKVRKAKELNNIKELNKP